MRLGAAVTAIDADGAILATGESLDTLAAVWAAGVVANELKKLVAGEKDKFRRLHVDSYLRTLSAKDIFATADAAFAATDDEGNFAVMSYHAPGYFSRPQRSGRSARHRQDYIPSARLHSLPRPWFVWRRRLRRLGSQCDPQDAPGENHQAVYQQYFDIPAQGRSS
jgi:hypothetical protein